MVRVFAPPLHIGAVLTAFAVMVPSCQDASPTCERCEFTFYWDSAGNLRASEEACRDLTCEYTMCGVCYDISYNEVNLPLSGTCDTCTVPPSCEDSGLSYCPMHFDECSALDWPEDLRCGCVDLEMSDDHCGSCYNACDPGSFCDQGACSRPGG